MTDILVQKLQEADSNYFMLFMFFLLALVGSLILRFYKQWNKYRLRKEKMRTKGLMKAQRLTAAENNIREHGWPPPHVDATGKETKFEPVPEVEEEE